MARLIRRVARLRARIDPAPAPQFLAFARAVIGWGGSAPRERAVRDLARALQRTEHGATWTALVALAEEDDTLDITVIDLTRPTPAEKEAGRLRALIAAGGPAALSDDDRALAECLRRKLNVTEDPVDAAVRYADGYSVGDSTR